MIYLTKAEINALKDFCDENIATGAVEIYQDHKSGIGYFTTVQVMDLPETLADITDYDSW